jgi:hypothetical protein
MKKNLKARQNGQSNATLDQASATHLPRSDEGFVDAKEALALKLNNSAVLNVAKSRLAGSERRLAAVRVDEVFHVFALERRRGA